MYAHLVRLYHLDCIHSPYTLYDLISQVADGGELLGVNNHQRALANSTSKANTRQKVKK